MSSTAEGGRTVAKIYYRDFTGRGRRVKRSGRSRAAARRAVTQGGRAGLACGREGEFTPSRRWPMPPRLAPRFRGSGVAWGRSPKTLDLYRDAVERHIVPGIGALRLGEVTTSRLDRFLQGLLANRATPRRSCAGRCCPASVAGWSGRRRWPPTRFVTSRRLRRIGTGRRGRYPAS